MQQGGGGGDYSSQYYPHPYPTSLPNSNDFPQSNPIQPPFASAPPYSHYPPPEFPSSYPPPYPQNPDPAPPSAPSYFQPYNPPPYPQDPSPPVAGAAPAPAPAPYPQPHLQQQQPYYIYDSHHLAPSPNPNPYENPTRFDQGSGGYFNDNSSVGGYGFGPQDGGDGLGDGVYAYDGGKVEPYGARGVGGFGRTSSSTNSSPGLKFDDYGRSLGPGVASGVKEQSKIVRAVPKMESQQDVKNGVQKFRVKLLPEGASVTTTDVLCQVGNKKIQH